MIISTPEAMFEYGSEAAKHHPFVLLQWELGAGKTTWTKGYAAGLDIDPALVHSPTFTYMNIYEEKLLHIDMYRMENPADLLHKWLLDAIDQYDHIVIERPKRTEQYAGEGRIQLLIEKKGDARDVTLSSP